MSAQTSQSQVSSGPVATTSQEESIRTYGCKWAWCRSTFSDNSELVHHVIHEHARRAIPVRRRDIPLLRRAEDGTGESLALFSYTFTSQSSNITAKSFERLQEEIRQDAALPSVYEPSSSLPSPPASSLAGFSPLPNAHPLTEATHPSKPTPGTKGDGHREVSPVPTTPPAQLLDESTNTFASLSSPAGSAASFAIADIPNSPSFSSLVEKSVKRKLTFDAPENLAPRKSKISRHHPLSQSTRSSTGSHASVEQHLTQSLDSENEEEDSGAIGEDETSEQHSSSDEDITHGPSNMEEGAYTSELHWGRSRHEASQPVESQEPNFTQDSGVEAADFDLLSQAPSQFQADSFPYHYHGPKASSSSQIEPKSTAPLPLSSPAPLPSPKYATSTPQRQNWYQNTHLVQRSSKVEKSDLDEEHCPPSPRKSQRTPSRSSSRVAHNSSKSKKFKSGTLQILPASQVPESITEEPVPGREDLMNVEALSQDVYGDVMDNPQSQSYSDSSQSLDDFSYPPLQTQAPYQSQSMSQF